MPTSSAACFEWLDHSKIKTPAEAGKSATFQNAGRDRVLLVHADRCCRKGRMGCVDCFFGKDQKVADYIVCKPRCVDVVVELKGIRIMEALEQIESTIATWRVHSKCCGKMGALIISSKGANSPNAQSHFLVKTEKLRARGIVLKQIAQPKAEVSFDEFL